MKVTPRQIFLILFSLFVVGSIAALVIQTLLGGTPVHLFASGAGSVVFTVLLVAYWRGWEYARHTVVICCTLLVVFFTAEPFITQRYSIVLFIPPILALSLLGPAWVVGSAVAIYVGLLIRAGGQGVYADPLTVLVGVLAIAGLALSRLVMDMTQRNAEENAQQAVEALSFAKQEYQELVQQQAKLRAQALLLTMVNQAIIAVDLDGAVTFWNRAAENLYGWQSSVIMGDDVRLLVTEESEAQVNTILGLARAGVNWSGELLLQRQDGSQLLAHITFEPLLDDDRQPIGLVSASHDITLQKHSETLLSDERTLLTQRVAERTVELAIVNAELTRAARLKDEFLASMSHELRTPLNTVLGLTEALQEQIYGPLTRRQITALRAVEESGRHLLALINEILDLAKIEAGKLTLEFAPVSVGAVCEASLQFIRQEAAHKHQSVSLSLDAQVTVLWADGRRLKQMLVNLLSNAVKFTPDGGKVGLEVTSSAELRQVLFTVWDTGIGIAEDDLPRLFQPFVQLNSSLARQYAGTGLGLVLVHRMTEMHGGQVAVESTLGKGSRFTVALPWVEFGDMERHVHNSEVQAQPVRPQPASLNLKPTGSTVLLTEDNEENLTLLSDYLDARGYRVVVARSGAEALAKVGTIHPDLILMDIQMPGMDGLETIARLRTLPALQQTPIIGLTAMAMTGDRERCLEAGADDYLSKPISLQKLIEIMETHLQRPPTVVE